ncbi:MAG: DM13 domain-containing protein [Labilibaculum sp.]|nr:DM13 domain-containing protein [Labilibaculum sp.]MBI9057873.1 DM13 domain-containing protein [Labilibaculum sp.]
MKNWYLYIALLLFTACSSSGDMIDEMEEMVEIPNDQENMMEEEETTTANFVSDAHPTSGTVILSDDGKTLSFADFKTDDGPLLEVYMASDLAVTSYVTLGELKGIEGDYQYTIPDGTDLESLKYVIIWCVDFSVSFGHAVLP